MLKVLHYSQTAGSDRCISMEFYYPINLHYSQTVAVWLVLVDKFYYPIILVLFTMKSQKSKT